jgi:hypothetical protein
MKVIVGAAGTGQVMDALPYGGRLIGPRKVPERRERMARPWHGSAPVCNVGTP